MFQELMPLLSQRVLILTLSRVTDDKVRVNVIPKPLKSGQQNDDNALTTPLAVTGTPNELDEQLATHLTQFVETHLGLSSTLKSAKDQMEAAAKAARETAKKSTSAKTSGAGKPASPSQVWMASTDNQQSSAGESTTEGVESVAQTEPAGPTSSAEMTGSLFDPAG